ncbi:MAG: hypothetical protein KGL39_03530 [Patescibacteria group bacterium]|nr:hypothetical protein [Patescibacteria group bacterium]
MDGQIKDKREFFLNHLDLEGASRLRKRLIEYWHSRGHTNVHVSIVPGNYRQFSLYGIRSNLVNGLPPSRTVPRGNPALEKIARAHELRQLQEFLVPPAEAA